jgi:hypothetical protein
MPLRAGSPCRPAFCRAAEKSGSVTRWQQALAGGRFPSVARGLSDPAIPIHAVGSGYREAALAVEVQPTAAQQTRLTEIIRQELGHPFEIRYRWQTQPLARGPGGKFEEFVCLAE